MTKVWDICCCFFSKTNNHQQMHDKCTLSLNLTMPLDSFGWVWMLSLSKCYCVENFIPLHFFLFFMYHTALLTSAGMAFAIDSFQQLHCLCHSTGVWFFKSWHPPPQPSNMYISVTKSLFHRWIESSSSTKVLFLSRP